MQFRGRGRAAVQQRGLKAGRRAGQVLPWSFLGLTLVLLGRGRSHPLLHLDLICNAQQRVSARLSMRPVPMSAPSTAEQQLLIFIACW